MEKGLLIIFIICMLGISPGSCQNPAEELLSEIADEYISEDLGEQEIQEITEELLSIFYSPLDINLATEAELKKLIFLNDFQVYTFLEYRQKYGRILSVSELKLVPGFRERDVYLSKYFLNLNPQYQESRPNKKNIYVSQKLLTRFKMESPEKKGFSESADSLSR